LARDSTVKISSIRKSLTTENLDRLILRVTLLIRFVLMICILLSSIVVVIIAIKDYWTDDRILALLFFATFYSVLWGTLPAVLTLIAISLDNRFRKKQRLQPLRTEVRLLIVNIAVLLIAFMITLLVNE
jgi:hypothetical protein